MLRAALAAYDAWQRRQQLPVVEPAWQVAVREASACHTQRYGTGRLRAEVQAQSHSVDCWRIRRVLKAHGLIARPPHSFVQCAPPFGPGCAGRPNCLLGQLAPTAPDCG